MAKDITQLPGITKFPTELTQCAIFRMIDSGNIFIGTYVKGKDDKRFGGEIFKYEIIGYANDKGTAQKCLLECF